MKSSSNHLQMKLGGLVDVQAIVELLESIKECKYRTSSSRDITKKNRKWTVSIEVNYFTEISLKFQAEEEILSANDWHTLLKESKCILFKKNDIIVKEGEWATSIYQIGKGRQVGSE